MYDLISRKDAIDAISTWDKFGVDEHCRVVRWHEGLEPYIHLRDVVKAIENLPSAQKKGEWIFDNRYAYIERYICSSCNESYKVDTCMGKPMWNYCPNCGADMRKEVKSC